MIISFLKKQNNQRYILILAIFSFLALISIFCFLKKENLLLFFSKTKVSGTGLTVDRNLRDNVKKEDEKNYLDNNKFRDLSINFIKKVTESYFTKEKIEYPKELEIKADWKFEIKIYHNGEVKGEGKGEDSIVYLALEEATKETLKNAKVKDLKKEDIKDMRFLATFFYPPQNFFSFLSCDEKAREVQDDLVITRNLTKDLILEKIKEGKEFLLRAENQVEHGFYKKYDVLNDDFGERLYTVYSASIIYTLLKIYDFNKDQKILQNIPQKVDFLLRMQSKDKENYGAFHYSYYFEKKEKEPRFVVGTAALSIFTLLDLYERLGDQKYLESSKLAGDWLIIMQREDGSMIPEKKQTLIGEWVISEKESLLYNGQVLSALSRLYRVTGEEKYYAKAERIAQRFVEEIKKERCYIGDDFRAKNPISSAWALMSLLDFYKINKKEDIKDIILKCGDDLLKRQQQDLTNPLNYGVWTMAFSSSGNGWLSEVMVEMEEFCKAEGGKNCEEFMRATLRAILWLFQNTYSKENTFFLKNPEKAIGGLFWNQNNKYVRTDSLCHALNAYVGVVNDVPSGILISLPEKPLEEILNEIKK